MAIFATLVILVFVFLQRGDYVESPGEESILSLMLLVSAVFLAGWILLLGNRAWAWWILVAMSFAIVCGTIWRSIAIDLFHSWLYLVVTGFVIFVVGVASLVVLVRDPPWKWMGRTPGGDHEK